MAYPRAKLQPNEHGLQVPTYTLPEQVKRLRADGFRIEGISWPVTDHSIIIWFYWRGKRPAKLPPGAFQARLAPKEYMIHVPKRSQRKTLEQLQENGHRILAVDYDDKGKGRIWFE